MRIGADHVKWLHPFWKKVNTEDQQELASIFGIQSIPSILFIPKEGQPQMAMGALPKESFVKIIVDVLKVK